MYVEQHDREHGEAAKQVEAVVACGREIHSVARIPDVFWSSEDSLRRFMIDGHESD